MVLGPVKAGRTIVSLALLYEVVCGHGARESFEGAVLGRNEWKIRLDVRVKGLDCVGHSRAHLASSLLIPVTLTEVSPSSPCLSSIAHNLAFCPKAFQYSSIHKPGSKREAQHHMGHLLSSGGQEPVDNTPLFHFLGRQF